ncbi:MAG TPA: CHAT domain-containing protein [Longimicrobiaceae bacterium]
MQILRAAAAGVPKRDPALEGRARLSLGNVLNRGETAEQGLEEAREAARLFARVGERENEGAALSIVTDARFVLGEADSGYVSLHRALDRLKPYRASVRLHNHLVAAARIVAADGLLRSALRLQDEGIRLAVRSGRSDMVAEARLERARLLASAGDLRGAMADVEAARPLVQAVKSPYARAWLTADLQEAEAASFHDRPGRAAEAFDSAAAFFDSIGLAFRVVPQLVGAAEARLADGDPAGAAQRLETVVRLLDRRRDSIRVEPRRAAVFDAARGVVDRIVMLKLAEGRVSEALEHMDRGRASLAPAGAAPGAGRDGGARAPPGEVAVEYARVADTLLAWTVAGARVEVFRTVVDTVWLTATLAELEGRLERGAGEAEVAALLSALYERLVRPLEARLGAPGTPVVVIADGEIASVPFAALRDARRGRYLVQDHPIRFAVSLSEARRGAAAGPAGGALFVADPAFDSREHPLLDPLEHARTEVRSISGAYPGGMVLEGPAATRPGVEAALARAGMVHFAGHAVFDDARPERSYLVLAPTPGAAGSGRLTAAELARLDLRHVRLVVLAACRTVRSGRSRAGGFTGLSGALLAAGAGGAVGSTWDVDDRSTAALMSGFHRAYRGPRDGPRALQAAQLALLRSDDPALRTPSAWAGFRYAGR